MDELGAVEVPLVRRTSEREKSDQDHNRYEHGIRRGPLSDTLIHDICQLIDHQRGGQPEERGLRQVDPDVSNFWLHLRVPF